MWGAAENDFNAARLSRILDVQTLHFPGIYDRRFSREYGTPMTGLFGRRRRTM
jgi:hypothetical protein